MNSASFGVRFKMEAQEPRGEIEGRRCKEKVSDERCETSRV